MADHGLDFVLYFVELGVEGGIGYRYTNWLLKVMDFLLSGMDDNGVALGFLNDFFDMVCFWGRKDRDRQAAFSE